MPTKDQFRDPAEANHRPPPPQLPDTPPGVTALAALDVGPPGFRTRDPPTPPLPRSSLTDEEELMLQRRAPLGDQGGHCLCSCSR